MDKNMGRPVIARFSLVVGLGSLMLIWWLVTAFFSISPTILPSPVDAATALLESNGVFRSLWISVKITLVALLVSAVLGAAIAVLLSQWLSLEAFVLPMLVTLQVTPVVVLAPIVVVAAPMGTTQVIVAFLVAFFPITINTLQGLKSAPPVLVDAMALYPVSRWQVLYHLRWPFALPFFFSGLRTGAGLALVGAIIADMMTGRGGQYSGIGMRIQIALQSNTKLVFGEAILVTLVGILLLEGVSLLYRMCQGRWRRSDN